MSLPKTGPHQQSYMHIMYLLFVNHTYTYYDPGNSLLYEHSQPRGKQGLNVNPERKSHVKFPKADSTGIPGVGKFVAHVEWVL